MATGKQILQTTALGIKPIKDSPIDKNFFNGNSYIASDGVEYPGYSPVASGTISDDPNDENYISDEVFKLWAIDAYYDIDSYTNKAVTVLGIFQEVPNFSSIPVFVKDQIMRAIAAKMEQNLYTKPANAEIKVTLTQSSGGRTTTEPARENFNPTDLLNQKVKAYIDGSGIDKLIKDSFTAILLNRNDYYTKDEIEELINSKQASIEGLYTADVDNWVPVDPGDGVNFKYVKEKDDELQAQINALIVGDVELKSSYIKLLFPFLESISGAAVHQSQANLEFTAGHKNLSNKITEIGKRVGVPLKAYKTEFQNISGTTPQTIINYDEINKGTVDSLNGMNTETGQYTISTDSLGDLISVDISFTVAGRPLQTVKSGTAWLYRNGELLIHPVTNNAVKADFILETTLGTIVSLNAKDIPIRALETGDGELEIGDILELKVSQSLASSATNIPLTISKVHFDLVNMRTLNKDIFLTETSDLKISQILDETPSGNKENQSLANIDFTNNIKANKELAATELATGLETLDNKLQPQITDNKNKIDSLTADVGNAFQIIYDMTYPVADEPVVVRKNNPMESLTNGVIATWIEIGELLDGQAIIGGASSSGSVKSHNHQWSNGGGYMEHGGNSLTVIDHINTYDSDGTIIKFGSDQGNDFTKNAYTNKTGSAENKAYGLGIGNGYKLWKRIL